MFGTGVDVPGIAHDVEEFRGGVSGLDRPECIDPGTDAQQIGDRTVHLQCQSLWQIGGFADHVDRSRRGCHLPGDEPEQRRLAAAVGTDESGAAMPEGRRDVGQGGRAVGPVEKDLT